MFDALATPRAPAGPSAWCCWPSSLIAVAAGCLGGSVADRLGPYGADDPDTESVPGRAA